jgi:hypothetical protein
VCYFTCKKIHDYWARDNLLEEEIEQILIKFSREDPDTNPSDGSDLSIPG